METPACVKEYNKLRDFYKHDNILYIRKAKMPPDVQEFYSIINYKKRLRKIAVCKDRKSKLYDYEALTEELAFHLENTHTQQDKNIIFFMKYQPEYLTEVGEQTAQCSFGTGQLTPYKLYRLLTLGRKTDLYCTNCNFQSNYSRASFLAYSAECLILDIDYYNIPALEKKSAETVYAELQKNVFQPKKLEPAYAIDSGHGLYVVFLLDKPLLLFRQTRNTAVYKESMNALITMTKAYGSDPSCTDLSRVLRLPQVINSKTGRFSKILDFDSVKKSPLRRYGIEELTQLLNIKKIGNNDDPPIRLKSKSIDSVPRVLSATMTLKTLAQARKQDLIKWLKNRNYDIEGYRANFFLILATCLSEIKDRDSTYFYMKEINNQLKAPLPISQLKRIHLDAVSERISQNGEFGHYRYSNQKIMELLKISPDEMPAYKTLITPDEKRKRDYAKRKKQRRNSDGLTKRQAAKSDKLIQIRKYLNCGKSKAEIARLIGVSKALVSIYSKQLNEAVS
ncbi:protein of unknown function [Ruminococcaceae bacterium BL-6]|jgi:hypothetical protein|nr:protein of unknown function [Ruminococcaceae bacterium BL-6]